MSKEAISRVREAEAQAAEIRAQAEKKAATRIEQTEKACVAQAERAIAATDAALREELDRVKTKAEELVEESRREVMEDVTAMEAMARESMREAVKLIVWEMYDSCQ